MVKWIYTDHKLEQVCFECDGNLSLSEADALYQDFSGMNVAKQMYIGVTNTSWLKQHVLVLDDDQHRLDVFRERYEKIGYLVVTVTKYHECISALLSQKWSIVHLDHDLAESESDADSYQDGWNNTIFYNGGHVVKEILSGTISEEYLPSHVIIHSVNPIGAQMRDDLSRFGISTVWDPFTE